MGSSLNARAVINLNRRSYETTALLHLRKITDQLIEGSYDKACKVYPSVVGANSQDSCKKWIIDIDDKTTDIRKLRGELNRIRPIENKFIATIPSRQGYHLITKPFDIKAAEPILSLYGLTKESILKNNPTNLYIP